MLPGMKQDAATGRMVAMSVEERFWSGVKKGRPDECWPWMRSRGPGGYGWLMGLGEKKAHRIAYILQKGPIPKGMEVLHKCDNPPCCNGACLFLGTQKDNEEDAKRKGRMKLRGAHGNGNGMRTHPGLSRGARNGMATMTEAMVVHMREARAGGASLEELADLYESSKCYVSAVCSGRVWKHAGGPITRRAYRSRVVPSFG